MVHTQNAGDLEEVGYRDRDRYGYRRYGQLLICYRPVYGDAKSISTGITYTLPVALTRSLQWRNVTNQIDLDKMYDEIEQSLITSLHPHGRLFPNAKQEVIEIDNRGERLTGCLSCNLWAPADGDRWVRLSVEDLHALHQLRHGGYK